MILGAEERKVWKWRRRGKGHVSPRKIQGDGDGPYGSVVRLFRTVGHIQIPVTSINHDCALASSMRFGLNYSPRNGPL